MVKFENYSVEDYLEAVRKYWYNLAYVPKNVQLEHPEIFLEAIRQDGWALQFVHNQTEQICLEAVKNNGLTLQYVHNQTEQICLEAVRQDGFALRSVHNQTEQICLEAVRQNGYALQYVHNQTEQICYEAVRKDSDALQYVEKFYPSLLELDSTFMDGYKKTFANEITKWEKAQKIIIDNETIINNEKNITIKDLEEKYCCKIEKIIGRR